VASRLREGREGFARADRRAAVGCGRTGEQALEERERVRLERHRRGRVLGSGYSSKLTGTSVFGPAGRAAYRRNDRR